MVEKRAKDRRGLFSGWLHVFVARRGAHRPYTKQINRIRELAGLWKLVSGPNKRRFYDQYG